MFAKANKNKVISVVLLSMRTYWRKPTKVRDEVPKKLLDAIYKKWKARIIKFKKILDDALAKIRLEYNKIERMVLVESYKQDFGM